MKKVKNDIPLKKQTGKQLLLSKDLESNLADSITTLCEVGFSPTKVDILDSVAEYLKDTNIVVTKFKNNRPGHDWFQDFKKRYGFSLKKANMISAARKCSTGNPFIIYDFHEQLKKIVNENNLCADQISNCDENGFPTDPQKCKVVSKKGRNCI